jgi:hypothetical protein
MRFRLVHKEQAILAASLCGRTERCQTIRPARLWQRKWGCNHSMHQSIREERDDGQP